MRRETDFVLEKAAWPTMLLEAGGRICRANQAARRVFGFSNELTVPPLSALWDEANDGSAINFLQQGSGAETTELNLRLHDGQKSKFIAHVAKVVRDDQDYFVLQLFKESGSAFSELAYVPVPKSLATVGNPKKIPSSLAQAEWPAVVVDAQGRIIDSNPSATRVFGAETVVEGATLAENITAPFRIRRSPAGDNPKSMLLQFFEAEAKTETPALAEQKKSEDEFILQNAEWPVFLVNKTGGIIRVNRAGARAFGTSMERPEARLETIWSPLNRGSCQQFLNLPPSQEPLPMKFLLKSGLPGEYKGQLCATAQDDVFLLQLLSGAGVGADAALSSKTAVPTVDTTGKSGVDSGLAHKQKLDCALQLARSVALDFNNALTSILGHTSLMLGKIEPNHPWRSSLGEIEKSAAKAAEIANDLATFSRQEKDVKVQVAGNVNTLLERTVEMFQGSMQSAISFSRQLERKLFAANFDEAKMQQALVKIFENAVESIKGDGRINLVTRNLELTEPTTDRTAKLNPGNYVCVEVSDTGTGIPDDIMPRIFEPFFSTKGVKHRGLGLAWVYGIVTNHGGGVAVSSQVNVGTTVRLYLPASSRIVREIPTPDSDLNGTQTILFVDDEDLLLTMGRMVLSSYGYTVLTANSGQKALELFTKSSKKIDLVITDLVMPNMSGRELSEHITTAVPGTRILWCSGYHRSANAQEQERYLQKPFSAQDLLRKVKQVLAL